jgi:ATP-dependent DNA ligase
MIFGTNSNIDPESFLFFASTLEKLSDTLRIDEKIQILKQYLLCCQNETLELTLQFLSGEYLLLFKDHKISIGTQVLGRSATDFLEIDYDLVFRPCRKAMGKTPETIARLLENIDIVSDKTSIKSYTISQIMDFLIDFNECKKQPEKLILVNKVWTTLTPVEVRFFIQLLTGKLSIGLTTEIILNTYAITYNYKLDKLRKVYHHSGSLTKTGVLAAKGIKHEVINNTPLLTSKIQSVLLYVQSESRGLIGAYSELTVGIRVEQNERFDQDYIPIGKIAGEIGQVDLEKLNQLLPSFTLQKFGTTLMLKPIIVVEIEFEQVVKNNRTKAGYSIKSPRIVSFQWDKNPVDSHNLEYIIELYQKNSR